MYEANSSAGGPSIVMWLVILGLYLYFAWTQYKIAQKVGCSDKAWWSFIPIMNTFLLVSMASKQWWWFFILLVPVVNIVAFAILWIEVAKATGQSPAWGVLMLIPFLNFVAIGIMVALPAVTLGYLWVRERVGNRPNRGLRSPIVRQPRRRRQQLVIQRRPTC